MLGVLVVGSALLLGLAHFPNWTGPGVLLLSSGIAVVLVKKRLDKQDAEAYISDFLKRKT